MLKVERVLLTTSCSHALELALMALGVGPGDEVVMPSFTFVSTANAALRVGARPVFADIEAETLGLDATDAAARLTDRSKVLMPVHYAGIAPDMDRLGALARNREMKLVEDAAQGLGGSFRGRPLGGLGDAGALSFHETKNITCGEGGALAIRDRQLAQRAEIIREKGTNRAQFLRGEVEKYSWMAEGSSFVLSDVLAALLDAQLDRLDAIQKRRGWVARRYREDLGDWAVAHGVRLPAELPHRDSPHHIFYLLCPDRSFRDRLLDGLHANGVRAAFHFVPLHTSPFGGELGQKEVQLPVTDRISQTLVRLPLHPLLSESDVARVVESVVRMA